MKYKYSTFKRRLAILLSAMLIGSNTFFVKNIFAQEDIIKYETVYANLKSDGSQRETITSNWLKDSQFKEKVIDKTLANSINNVNSNKKPVEQNNELIFDSAKKDVIYQGKIDKQLPISTHIKYYLDEKEVSADEIAGKSGKIKINIKFENNTTQTVNINGKNKNISTPFTVATVIGFDSEKFSNLKAENSKIFSDGNVQMVSFIGFPGLSQSFDLKNSSIKQFKDLNLPDELTITADAKEFELSSIAIVASPKLPDAIKNIDDDTKKLDDLQKDIKTTINARDTLKRVDPKDSIKSLIKDDNKTKDAKILVDDLFKYYDLDTSIIDILPKYITDKNISLFDRIKKHLSDVNIDYILDNPVLRNITDRLTDEQINKSRVLLKDYDEIKTFDMDRYEKPLEIINSYDALKPMIETSSKLYDKLDGHDKELDTLDKASKYTDRVFDLIDKIQGTSFNGGLSEDDINVMLKALAEKKTKEYSYMFTSLLPENDTDPLSKEQQGKLVYLIDSGMKNGQIGVTTGSQLMAIVNSGYVREPFRTAILNNFTSGIQRQVQSQINDNVSTARGLLQDVKQLQYDIEQDMGYNYKAEIRSALEYTDDLMPEIRYLREQKKLNDKILQKALDLAKNSDDMKYFQYWANRIKVMKADMDNNDENINVMRDLLEQYDDPKVSYFYSKIPVLRQDADEARPIINALKDELDIKKYNDSFHKSPTTITTLLEMKKDLDNKKYISQTLKISLNDEVVNVARQMLEIIDKADKEKKLEEANAKISDLKDSLKTKDVIINLSDNYNNFSGKEENMQSQVSFVMKTDEIEVPEKESKPLPQQEEKKSFIQWVKSLF